MPERQERWERRLGAVVGVVLLLIGAVSILIERAGAPTVVLLVVSAPLVYAGLGLPMPRIRVAGAVLSFRSPAKEGVADRLRTKNDGSNGC